MTSMNAKTLALVGTSVVAIAACTPQVQVVAPDKPIEINLNVNITQEVRVKLENDIQDLIAENPEIF